MLSDSAIEAVRSAAKIEDVARLLGLDLRRRGPARLECKCPDHADGNRTTLAISPHKGDHGLWHCFSCGEGGDPISLFRFVRGCDFKTAVSELGASFGVEVEGSSRMNASEAAAARRRSEISRRQFMTLRKNDDAASEEGFRLGRVWFMGRQHIAEKFGFLLKLPDTTGVLELYSDQQKLLGIPVPIMTATGLHNLCVGFAEGVEEAPFLERWTGSDEPPEDTMRRRPPLRHDIVEKDYDTADPACGGVVTIGRRDEATGRPVSTDRFFIVDPVSQVRQFRSGGGKAFSALSRSLSRIPAFAIFNRTPGKGCKTQIPRDSILCETVFARLPDNYQRKHIAKTLPGVEEQGYFPACEGDGETAYRLCGCRAGEPLYDRIACPGPECPYREKPDAKCSDAATIWFRIVLPLADGEIDLNPIVRLTTGGYETAGSIKAMFDTFDLVAGRELQTYAGQRFILRVGQQSHTTIRGRTWPVAKFSPVGDVLEAEARQLQRGERRPPDFGAEEITRILAGDIDAMGPAKPLEIEAGPPPPAGDEEE